MANTITTCENIWKQCFESQMNPFISILCIDGSLYRMLDAGAKRYVALRFMEHVPDEVMYCMDGTGVDRVYLGAPHRFVSGQGMVISPIGSDPIWIMRPLLPVVQQSQVTPAQSQQVAGQSSTAGSASTETGQRIPRPPNAYILYRKERHQLIKDANPGITNNEISQILGKAWNIESREIRFKYKEMAERIKNALLKKYPHYQYRPRRPCERRRRARRSISETSILGSNIDLSDINLAHIANMVNANMAPEPGNAEQN